MEANTLKSTQESEEPEVEGHMIMRSDESLKQAIAQVKRTLETLRKLEAAAGEGEADVEGHMVMRSDENLKQAVAQVERALESLRKLEVASKK